MRLLKIFTNMGFGPLNHSKHKKRNKQRALSDGKGGRGFRRHRFCFLLGFFAKNITIMMRVFFLTVGNALKIAEQMMGGGT